LAAVSERSMTCVPFVTVVFELREIRRIFETQVLTNCLHQSIPESIVQYCASSRIILFECEFLKMDFLAKGFIAKSRQIGLFFIVEALKLN
jgi:hypothetical protein